MPAKTPARSKKAAEPTAEATVDFPASGETVLPGHYAVRISTQLENDVEINVGGKEWFACRESLGFFWFDWWPSNPGPVTLSVRVKTGKGKWKNAAERACRVAPGGTN